jgi:hypothetical protein
MAGGRASNRQKPVKWLSLDGGGMKKELLKYLSGLCQAALAALLASAVIMPDTRTPSLIVSGLISIMGAVFVVLREKGE